MEQTEDVDSLVIRKSVSLRVPTIAIVESVEKDLSREYENADFSSALRFIVKDWARLTNYQHPSPSPAPAQEGR